MSIDYAGLMTKAALLRDKYGEDNKSPIEIFSFAQNIEDLTLVFFPMGENLSGMCIKGQNENIIIAVNSGMTLGRQKFSLAHEFYHMEYDTNMVTICPKNINSESAIEKSANMFASYFLIPDTALVPIAKKLIEKHPDQELTLNDVIRIEQYFGVSHQAAVYRLLNMRYLSDDLASEYLDTPVRRKAEALGYSSDLYLPLSEGKQYMTYGKYISQAEELIAKELISYGKYEELLLDAFRHDLVYGNNEEGDLID